MSEYFCSGSTKCVCEDCGIEKDVKMVNVPIDFEKLLLFGGGNISAAIGKDAIHCRQCRKQIFGETVFNNFVSILVVL